MKINRGKTRSGGIRFGEFVEMESIRLGRNAATIKTAIKDGCYKGLKIRRTNQRVIHVMPPTKLPTVEQIMPDGSLPQPGEMKLKRFIEQEIAKGSTEKIVRTKIIKGQYPGMVLRKVNARLIYISFPKP